MTSGRREPGPRHLTPVDRDGLAADLPQFNLSGLTDRQIEVVCMRYRRDLSYAEIGRLLGINRVSAWHLHRRAVRALRRHDANKTPL